MKIFVDSANIEEIKKFMSWGICDGVTTNPSICLKDGVKSLGGFEERVKSIAALLEDRPLSVEVTTDDREEMIKQGRELAAWASNIVVKIPIINSQGKPCLGVIKTLTTEGIKVNVTAMMDFNQAVLAAKAGGTYLSLFGGRIEDEGMEASTVIMALRRWLDDWEYHSEIIVGSTRTVMNVQQWAQAGAHILTITPSILDKMTAHAYTQETVKQFMADAQKAIQELGR